MTAPDVLHQLREYGLIVKLDDGRLIVTPADRLTDETRQLIRDNKPGIVAALAVVATCPTCKHSRKPGASRYCCARPELPPAYGDGHPLRQLPDDGGADCGQWAGRA